MATAADILPPLIKCVSCERELDGSCFPSSELQTSSPTLPEDQQHHHHPHPQNQQQQQQGDDDDAAGPANNNASNNTPAAAPTNQPQQLSRPNQMIADHLADDSLQHPKCKECIAQDAFSMVTPISVKQRPHHLGGLSQHSRKRSHEFSQNALDQLVATAIDPLRAVASPEDEATLLTMTERFRPEGATENFAWAPAKTCKSKNGEWLYQIFEGAAAEPGHRRDVHRMKIAWCVKNSETATESSTATTMTTTILYFTNDFGSFYLGYFSGVKLDPRYVHDLKVDFWDAKFLCAGNREAEARLFQHVGGLPERSCCETCVDFVEPGDILCGDLLKTKYYGKDGVVKCEREVQSTMRGEINGIEDHDTWTWNTAANLQPLHRSEAADLNSNNNATAIEGEENSSNSEGDDDAAGAARSPAMILADGEQFKEEWWRKLCAVTGTANRREFHHLFMDLSLAAR